LRPAATRHHFMSGAQKKMVFGPAGWFIKLCSFEVVAVAAAPDIFGFEKRKGKSVSYLCPISPG